MSSIVDPATAYRVFCVTNLGMLFIGPQRGEMLLPTNEKHIVPHIGCLAVSLALMAVLI